MQIYEITEGVLGNMLSAATGNYSGMAQSAAAKLQKQGYGTGYQQVDANKIWPTKLEAIKKDPAVQQYINGLVSAWQTQSTTTNEEVDPANISSAKTGKPTAADYAKLQRKIKAATTAAPIPVTAGQKFQEWSDAQLVSRVPGTGEQITMDAVRKLTGLDSKLEQALAKVNASQGTTAGVTAVKQYLELAIAGIQAKSQQSKSMRATGSKLSGKYAKSTGNNQADQVLKAAGFKLS
jgi:hypothetical protein